ncbi:MAG: histidine kinase dimerization/phospho-acceptor domain-containing protein [Parvibaculales bacterium]
MKAEETAPRLTLLQESPEAMVILTNDGKISFVNQAAELLIGKTASELLGKPFHSTGADMQREELRLHRPDGEERIVELCNIATQEGEQTAHIASLTDITMRKRLHAAMEEMERSQSLLFSNAAHDLLTPLTHIMGFAELLAAEPFGELGTPDYKDYAKNIVSSTELMLALIRDMLLSHEDLVSFSGEENIDNCIKRALEACEKVFRSKNTNIDYKENTSLPTVLIPQEALRRAMVAILIEASHMVANKGRIKITTEYYDGLVIKISPQTEQPQTKDNYVLDAPLMRSNSLGVNLARRLMESMGGGILIEVKGNLCFMLRLPEEVLCD